MKLSSIMVIYQLFNQNSMNKLTIPTILVATVMVAGIFAFAPVEQASTVHTTIGIQNVVSVADQDASANAVILATSATVKAGDVCVQYTEGGGGDDNPILHVDLNADGSDVNVLAANIDVETCSPFAGHGINIDAVADDAADLLDYIISYKEATP